MTGSLGRGSALRFGVWSALTLALMFASIQFLVQLKGSEIEAAYRRTEFSAMLAERALQRTHEAGRGVQNLLRLHYTLRREGDTSGADLAEAQLHAVLQEQRLGIVAASVTDLAGRVSWSSSPQLIGIDISDRDYFRDLFLPGASVLSISAALQARPTGDWRIIVARLIRDDAGQPIAVGALAVDPLVLSDELAAMATSPGQRIIILRLRDGTVRAASQEAARSLARGPRPDDTVLQAARLEATGRASMIGDDGARLLGTWRSAADLPLVILSGLDRDVELADFLRTARIPAVALFLFALLSLALLLAWERNAKLRDHLASEATLDPLTGLHNRRGMAREAGSALSIDRPASLLLFDLDHFGAFNARFGHAGGDAALRAVAEALRAEIRKGDVICRWGGEELAVILTDCPMEQAMRRAEDMRRAIEGRRIADCDSVTASIGVACFPRHGTCLDDLVAEADRALYAAKRAGRNRVMLAA